MPLLTCCRVRAAVSMFWLKLLGSKTVICAHSGAPAASTEMSEAVASNVRTRLAIIGSLLWVGEQGGRPVEALAAQPRGGEPFGAMLGERVGDGDLVSLRGSGGERERHFRQAELEQSVAAA